MLAVAGGLVLLFFGGEALVRGSVALAGRLRISKVVVGMVIVGFGTSAPELVVSVQAALAGSPEIAIGNIVGSNIANILLIIGIAALLAPLASCDRAIRREALIMLAVSLGLALLLPAGHLGRLSGLAMLALLAVYLGVTYRLERKRRASAFAHEAEEVREIALSTPMAAVAALAGLVLLVFGARMMVHGASGIARAFDISEAVIGLTIVAVGTSLPELATSIVAALRRHGDVVLANIVGSNIFNILCILGLTAAISPIPVAARFASLDGPVMVAVAALSAALFVAGRPIGRGTGAALLAAYGIYLLVQGAAV
jgi:cation:H+ antiporter